MNAKYPNDSRLQSIRDIWNRRPQFNTVFNCLAISFFILTALLVVFAQASSVAGRAGISFICGVFCALIGNMDRIESLKTSFSGIEAKTREIIKTVDEARVALKEFHALAEMTGSFLIELMAGAGRWGGNPPDYDSQRRSRVINALTAIGL